MATLNIGLKVNRAITGATTVNANATVIATYVCTSHPIALSSGASWRDTDNQNDVPSQISTFAPQVGQSMVRIFGPSASVPASFTTSVPWPRYFLGAWSKSTTTITWTLQSGVELINTQ